MFFTWEYMMLHLKNYFKYNVRKYFEQYVNLDNKSVLDFGCNHGNFIRYNDHFDYTGIDINKNIIDNNIKKYPKYKWIYYNGYNYMYNSFGNEKIKLNRNYDVCISFSVMTHMFIDEMITYINFLKKYCGKIFVSYYSTSNKQSYENICHYRNLKNDEWAKIKSNNFYYIKTKDFLWTFYNDEYLKSIFNCQIKETRFDNKTLIGMQKCLVI